MPRKQKKFMKDWSRMNDLRKYKILYINGTSEIGGSDLNLLDLVKNLNRSKFTPLIVLPFPGPLVDKFKELKAEVIFVDMSVVKRTYNPIRISSYLLNFLPTVIRLKKLIKDEKIDLVHTNTTVVLGGGIASRLSGIRNVYHAREIVTHPKPIVWLLNRMIELTAHRIIAMTDAVVKVNFPSAYRRNAKIHTIYDGVDLELFDPKINSGTFRKEFNIKPDNYVIGMVGRMVPWKGHEYFIRAAEIVTEYYNNVKFIIVGDIVREDQRKYKKELIGLVKRSNLNGSFIFTGSRMDIPQVIADFDILVLPSSSPEPSGRVILEAMALAKPVIATNHGGPSELIIENKTGFLIPPRDSGALAEALINLLRNPELAKEMGNSGRKEVERRFDIRNHVKRVEEIYESLLIEKRS